MVEQSRRPKQVLGPLGSVLTMGDLPPPNVKRWIAHRKAIIVCAVRGGLITLEEVVDRYGITQEEFLSWERLLDEHGLLGPHATRRPGSMNRPASVPIAAASSAKRCIRPRASTATDSN